MHGHWRVAQHECRTLIELELNWRPVVEVYQMTEPFHSDCGLIKLSKQDQGKYRIRQLTWAATSGRVKQPVAGLHSHQRPDVRESRREDPEVIGGSMQNEKGVYLYRYRLAGQLLQLISVAIE